MLLHVSALAAQSPEIWGVGPMSAPASLHHHAVPRVADALDDMGQHGRATGRL